MVDQLQLSETSVTDNSFSAAKRLVRSLKESPSRQLFAQRSSQRQVNPLRETASIFVSGGNGDLPATVNFSYNMRKIESGGRDLFFYARRVQVRC